MSKIVLENKRHQKYFRKLLASKVELVDGMYYATIIGESFIMNHDHIDDLIEHNSNMEKKMAREFYANFLKRNEKQS